MNSIQNLKGFRRLSFLAIASIITLIISSTVLSTLISRAHTQAQQLSEDTSKQRLLLEKINQKASFIITEISYPISDQSQIKKTQSSIENDIDTLQLIHNKIHQDQSNTAMFIFNSDIQKNILLTVDLNVQSFIDGVKEITSTDIETQEDLLHLWTGINAASASSRIIVYSLDFFTFFIQDQINKITKTLETVYIGLNVITLITVVTIGRYLLYPAVIRIEGSLHREKKESLLLEHLANTDRLTDAGNRQKMDTFFKQYNENNTSTPITFLLLDLNKFKTINDNYGHNIGDALLVHISKKLKTLENKNTQLYRIGGDEFCLISIESLTNESIDELATIAMALVESPLHIDGQTLSVGVSIGIASSKNDTNVDFDSLMINADKAMYQAKSQPKTSSEKLSSYQHYAHLHDIKRLSNNILSH